MAFMIYIKDISNKKGWILLIGLMIGLGIISQPIVESYADCRDTSSIEQNSADDNSSDEKEVETQVTALQAVNSVVHIDVSPSDITTTEISLDTNPERTSFSELVEKIPPKLLKVLFNRIISPNAP